MNIMILDSCLTFDTWQVNAALNTRAGIYPAVPVNAALPYLYLNHIPIRDLTLPTDPATLKEVTPAALVAMNAPEKGAIMPVREPLIPFAGKVAYAADETLVRAKKGKGEVLNWRSMFGNLASVGANGMPKWAARLWFRLENQYIIPIKEMPENAVIGMGITSLLQFRTGGGLDLIRRHLYEKYSKMPDNTAVVTQVLKRVKGA